MNTVSIEEMMAEQAAQREQVLNNSDRGKSAYALATMALENGSSSARAAANLLLAMEDGKPFAFESLLSLDTTNRAHADLVMLGYKPHDLWPSRWMYEAGYHGIGIIDSLRHKWAENQT